ncbi:MAG: biotin--[acetyl-CoA-carboxylase] ligase [Chloroflexi bacterium]|nr:biotin--[acetyl-CoA-carboxylase] ligase [Chloroflexota bacterium]
MASYSPLDAARVQSALEGMPVGGRIIYLPEVTSTMDVARQETAAGSEEGLVVVAEEQTAGRGRFGRVWVSLAGQNLSFSVVLYPNRWAMSRLSVAASVAVARAIGQVTGLSPSHKWPNDLHFHGKKVAGILVESALRQGGVQYAIVGIGVNVNADPSEMLTGGYQATCLAKELGQPLSREELLTAVLAELGMVYMELKGWGEVWEEWHASLDTLGKEVRVQWGDRVEEGRAEGVDGDGNLILRRADGSLATLTGGEVTLQS